MAEQNIIQEFRLKNIYETRNYLIEEIVLLAKSKLNRIEVLISKGLIDSVISHDELFLINNVLIEYNEMKEEIKNLKT